MKFKVYDNAHDFERRIEPILLEKEDVFSLFLGVLQAIKAGKYENPFMATIEEDGKVERTPESDIDVIYFDNTNTDESEEKRFEQKLTTIHPYEPWSVKNEARMHIANNIPPYSSSFDAISKFPETATALGVKLDAHDTVLLAAPHGVADVLNLEVKPTDYFTKDKDRVAIYEERVARKNWKLRWDKVRIWNTPC